MSCDQRSDSSLVDWVDVPGYEGFYQVSSEGVIRRLPTVISRTVRDTTFNQRVPERTLKSAKNKAGYLVVSLCKDGIPDKRYVHEIVAGVFLGDRPEGAQIRHLDGDGTNPRMSNLKYGTPTENASDRVAHGTHAIGEMNPMATLSEDDVIRIKRELKTKSIKRVSDEMGVNYSTVRSINQGKNWKHVTID